MDFTFDFSPKRFAANRLGEIFRDFVTVWGSNHHRQTVRVRANGLPVMPRSAANARKGGSGAPRVATQGGAKAKGAKTPHWDDVETLVQLTQSPHTGRSQPPACVKENAHFPIFSSFRIRAVTQPELGNPPELWK